MINLAEEILIAGLGNPGKEYETTRHNIGFLVVSEMAKSQNWTFKLERQHEAKIAKGIIEDKKVTLMMPLTYMNICGRAIKRYLDYYRISFRNLIVVTDDIALPFGVLRLREKGSSGGHNGLKSVGFYLGTDCFARLKMGIGGSREKIDLADYVLSGFSEEEKIGLPEFTRKGAEVLQRLLKEPIAEVMNRFNTKVNLQTKNGQENQA